MKLHNITKKNVNVTKRYKMYKFHNVVCFLRNITERVSVQNVAGCLRYQTTKLQNVYCYKMSIFKNVCCYKHELHWEK